MAGAIAYLSRDTDGVLWNKVLEAGLGPIDFRTRDNLGNKDEVEAWGKSIQGYLQDRPQLALSIILFDARRGPEQEEEELLMWFRQTGKPCLAVMTKADKIGRSELESRRRKSAEILGPPTACGAGAP